MDEHQLLVAIMFPGLGHAEEEIDDQDKESCTNINRENDPRKKLSNDHAI